MIVVFQATVRSGNNLYPITKTIYRCSNEVCQGKADARNAKKEQLRKEQELAREKRAAKNNPVASAN